MSQGRYVWIAEKKVYLNPELQKEDVYKRQVQNSDCSLTGTDGKPKAWTVGKNDASYVCLLYTSLVQRLMQRSPPAVAHAELIFVAVARIVIVRNRDVYKRQL